MKRMAAMDGDTQMTEDEKEDQQEDIDYQTCDVARPTLFCCCKITSHEGGRKTEHVPVLLGAFSGKKRRKNKVKVAIMTLVSKPSQPCECTHNNWISSFFLNNIIRFIMFRYLARRR